MLRSSCQSVVYACCMLATVLLQHGYFKKQREPNVPRLVLRGIDVPDIHRNRNALFLPTQVEQALVELRTGREQPWAPPACCPACGSRLVREVTKEAETLVCKNRDCSGQSLRGLQVGCGSGGWLAGNQKAWRRHPHA